MTVRGKILLFATVAVGLVALVGGGLFALSTLGVWSTRKVFFMQEQTSLYARLAGEGVWVPSALIAAQGKGKAPQEVLDAHVQRVEADFARIRELMRQQVEPEVLQEELARLEEVREAYLGWLRNLETRVREAGGSAGAQLLQESIDAFQEEVLPRLNASWMVENGRLEEHERLRLRTLRWGQLFGVGVPLMALGLMFVLVGTLLITLRRSSRELKRGVQRIGQGDFTTELPVTGPDEYNLLARAFNRMAAELRDTVREKERLAKAEAEAGEREMRRYNALLEETVRRRTAELEEANAQLLFADRLVTVGQIAAGVGHEINNPLAFILSNLNYAREELGRIQGAPSPVEREELLSALSEAHEGAERVRLLVQDLKMLSRQDDAVGGPVDMAAVLRSASKMAAHEIRHRARLVMQSENIPLVHGNAARLCQVFLNLLINAAHAIAPGQVDRNEIQLSIRRDSDARVTVEVRDTGCGIAQENLERIFHPFFTTKSAGEGSGLGLSVCQRIITGHGGTITVESQVGRGTTFRVILPIHAASSEDSAPGVMAA